jgi:hypothetical protein
MTKYNIKLTSKYHDAIENEDINLVKELINNPNVDVNDTIFCSFETACSTGNREIISLLIENSRVDVFNGLHYGFTRLVDKNNLFFVEILMKNPLCIPSIKDNLCIEIAIDNDYHYEDNNIEMIKLLSSDPEVNKHLKLNHLSLYQKLLAIKVESKLKLF